MSTTKRTLFIRSGRSLAVAVFLTLSLAAFAEKQNVQPSQPVILSPEQAAKEGKILVAQLLSQKPTENVTNSGMMSIRSNGKRTQIPVQFEVFVTPTNWISNYSTQTADRSHFASVSIAHFEGQPSRYTVPNVNPPATDTNRFFVEKPADLSTPFAGSDFWFCDLGLEFLHWPDQRLVRKEMTRTRPCNVVESVNPKPIAGGYSRVVSWLDTESGGIVKADAYDASGKLLKEFRPTKVEKGQLLEMEMVNDQADSSTIIKFEPEAQ